MLLSKEKEDPEVPSIDKKKKQMVKPEATTSHSDTVND